MPIPDFMQNGALPPGVHTATLEEVEERFAGPGSSYRRRERMRDLKLVVDQLLDLGVSHIWIDGSFVTSKPRPQDVDVVCRPTTDPRGWPNLFRPGAERLLKQRHHVQLFRHPKVVTDRGYPQAIEEFFQMDRDDRPKGIVLLDFSGGAA